MSVVVEASDAEAPKPIASDERLGHRGPIRRLLISPEIGALTGAILVWLLFWSVGDQFGTAAGFGNSLDAAAPIGIMAVAIALLMIGGEFDLSSGAMTGASAVMVALMTTSWLKDGSNIWLAVTASFIACAGIGWWNGTMVNKTGLPSFIVTLGTFFVLKGAKLVFAKRLVGKVLIGPTDKAGGFKSLANIFVKIRKYQPFDGRDKIFVIGAIVAVAVLIFGLLEQSFIRRRTALSASLPIAAAGAAAAAVGFIMLLNTNGVGNNILWATVCLVGVIALIVGFARWRYVTVERTTLVTSPEVLKRLGIGCVLFVLGIVAAYVISRHDKTVILTFLPSGLRVVVAIAAGLIGAALAGRTLVRTLKAKFVILAAVRGSIMVLATALVMSVTVLAALELATIRALRAGLFVSLCILGLLRLLSARSAALKVSSAFGLAVGLLTSVAVIVFALVVRATSHVHRFRSGLLCALLLGAAFLAANAFLESYNLKRTVADPSADTWGRRATIGGAALGVSAMLFRLLYSGQGFRTWVIWWIIITIIGGIVLNRTKVGNWIYAVGGNKDAARAIGVPVDRVKVGMFVTVALAGWFVGTITLLQLKTVQASQGDGQEFVFIIAAVVGGNLLTGGYGSIIGASLGALILAMVSQGVPLALWNTDGQFIFQGALLLAAVLVNNFIRRKAQEAR